MRQYFPAKIRPRTQRPTAMKTLLFLSILPALLLSGCEVFHRPGIVIKEKISGTNKYGPYQKMADKLTVNADFPGLESVKSGDTEILIATSTSRVVQTVLDPKTGITTTTESQTPGGMYVSEHVRARGVADKSRGDSFWSGVTGAGLSLFGFPAAVKGGSAAVAPFLPR